MRMRAVLGGAAILGAIILWHRPSLDHGAGCTATNDGSICDAVTGISRAIHSPLLSANRAVLLPPPETPGAIDPAISQANIDDTICRPGYARSARPAYAITGPLKQRMMDAQHPGEAMTDYELDHLIPISIGGAPLDKRDLWLQPRQGQANAGDKNVLAYVLWRLVCTHQVPLQTAQHEISHDWTRAYQLYATPANIQKYHFRHSQEQRDEHVSLARIQHFTLAKESMMPQNIAEFRIIGRIGKITSREKVKYVSVAANYNRRDGDEWKTDTHWNSVVCFSNVASQVDNAAKGDLVHITGRVRESQHGEANDLAYRTELIADTFSVLTKADTEDN